MNKVLFIFISCVIALSAENVLASKDVSHELKFDREFDFKYDDVTNLVSINANFQTVHHLLNTMANEANFTLFADPKLTSLARKINLNVSRMPLEKAIDLLIGNTSRVITYEAITDDKLQIESVNIVGSVKTGTLEMASYHEETKRSIIKPNEGKLRGKYEKIAEIKRRLSIKRQVNLRQLKLSEKKLLDHIMGDDVLSSAWPGSEKELEMVNKKARIDNRVLASQ